MRPERIVLFDEESPRRAVSLFPSPRSHATSSMLATEKPLYSDRPARTCR